MPSVVRGIQIDGVKELEAALKGLERKARTSIIRKSMREGAKVIQEEAKAVAPVESGRLKKSIKVRAGKSRKKGSISVIVGTGEKWFTGDTFYGAMVEFGHKAGSRKLGDARKDVPAHPFLGPAADSAADRAAQVVVDGIWRRIREAAKA